jgi:copper chaperone CopZ
MRKIELRIDGMNCQHCVKAVENELNKLNLESFDVEIGSLFAEFDENFSSEEQIKNAVLEAGYTIKENGKD